MTFDRTMKKNDLGFWEVANKPDLRQIQEYYAAKYYQEAKGSYELAYSDEEIEFFRTKLDQRWSVIAEKFPKPGSMLDVGCGEGYALSYFRNKGWDVRGLDFSRAGVESKNPDCAQFLIEGDVTGLLEEERAAGARYDVIWLQNVLEHVLDPVALMTFLRSLVKPDGALVVTVPNDFSKLQLEAQRRGHIDREFWVALPDHLSYFSRDSLAGIGSATGWSVLDVLADFPIDWFLFHPGSNYVMNKEAGKPAHRARVALENLIGANRPEDVTAFYSAMARIGMGRDLTAFYCPENRADDSSE